MLATHSVASVPSACWGFLDDVSAPPSQPFAAQHGSSSSGVSVSSYSTTEQHNLCGGLPSSSLLLDLSDALAPATSSSPTSASFTGTTAATGCCEMCDASIDDVKASKAAAAQPSSSMSAAHAASDDEQQALVQDLLLLLLPLEDAESCTTPGGASSAPVHASIGQLLPPASAAGMAHKAAATAAVAPSQPQADYTSDPHHVACPSNRADVGILMGPMTLAPLPGVQVYGILHERRGALEAGGQGRLRRFAYLVRLPCGKRAVVKTCELPRLPPGS